MKLALAEMRGAKGRFASVLAALTLIVFLGLTLAALADGLFYGSTGLIRNGQADAYAFDSDAEGSFVRSRLHEADVAAVAAVPGVAAAGPVGTLLTSGTVDGTELDLAVVGVEPGLPGAPTDIVEGRAIEPGEQGAAMVDETLADDGVEIGSMIAVTDQGSPVEVVGFVADVAYQGQSGVFTSVETWRALLDAARPEAAGDPTVISAVAFTVEEGRSLAETSTAVEDEVDGTAVYTREEAVYAIPGVREQSSTLGAIIRASLVVSALVIGLFFALLTLEKRDLIAVLKAVGVPTRSLAVSLLVQSFVLSVAAVAVAAVLTRPLALVIPAEIPALFRLGTLVSVGTLAVVAGVLGAAFSLRRLARIDPATALGGTL